MMSVPQKFFSGNALTINFDLRKLHKQPNEPVFVISF